MKHFSVSITKRNDDQQMVFGYASTPARDFDGDIITLDAIKGSLPEYMKFANIREMHGMTAVGVAKTAEVDDKGLYIGCKIVDPLAWLKVKEGVYKAFSIGGNATARDPTDQHTITGLQLIEISLVDRPANPEAIIDVFKAVNIESEEKAAMTKSNEEQLRSELMAAVNKLDGDALTSAVESLRKSQKTEPVEPKPEPVVKTAAPAPVGLSETPAKRIARCLKMAGAQSALRKSVAEACGFNDSQFANIVAMDQNAVANWLGNNHGLLEKIEKAVPADSKIWEQKPVVMDETQEITLKVDAKAAAAELEKAGKKVVEEIKKAAADETDEGYADPGLQDDKKARFPLKVKGAFSEQRIRSAWNYISKAKNQTPYSAEALDTVKGAITAAWQEAISADGPSADQPNKTETNVKKNITTPDARGDMRKGLLTAMSAIGLLDRLNLLRGAIVAEETMEGDGSQVGTRFSELLQLCADATKAYVDEEIGEMLSGEGGNDYGMPYSDYIAYADKAQDIMKRFGFGGEGAAEILTKAIGDRTGEPGFDNLSKFAEDVVAKSAPSGQSGDWATVPDEAMDMKQDWKSKAQDLHDLAKSLGATCEHADVTKGGVMECPHCGAENKKGAATCTKCDKPMKKAAKADATKGKKGPNDGGGDDEAEDTDGGDDNEEDDQGGNDNPKKPTAKKKAAAVDAGISVDTLASALNKALESSPLAKSVEALQNELKSLKKNPPLPGKTPVAVSKAQDGAVEDPAKKAAVEEKPSPEAVLKGILNKPNFIRNNVG